MVRTSLQIVTFAAMAGAIALVSQAIGRGDTETDALSVSRIIPVESHPVDGNFVDETFRAEIANSGPPGHSDVARVTARIVHPFNFPHPGSRQIIDGDVTFGAIRGGATAESLDTFTVRRHRNTPLTLHQLRWAISARRDLVLPDAWAAKWDLTITTRDRATNRVTSIAHVTDTIGTGEPFGFSLMPEFLRCTWSATDDQLAGGCSARAQINACGFAGAAQITIARDDAALDGEVEWNVALSGDCGHAESSAATLKVSGVRLSASAEPEPASPGLLAKIATEAGLIALIEEGLRDQPDRPDSSHECRRGGWRRFMNPTFRNAHECESAGGHDDGSGRHESRK